MISYNLEQFVNSLANLDYVNLYFGIVRYLNSVRTCISEWVSSHLEGMCSDCK